MLHVRGPAQLSTALLPGDGVHSFEVATASLVYCVAAGEDGEAWADAIRQALMPIEENRSMETTQGERRQIQTAGVRGLTGLLWFQVKMAAEAAR